MNIATTINLRTDLLEKLVSKREELKISLNKIVSHLLSKALNCHKKSIKTFKSIKYQKKKENIGWHKLHISMDIALYERCIDMRKLYKLSVSYILALCIKMYLDLLIKKSDIVKKTDNYHNCYIFLSNTEENVFSFTIFWSLPNENIIKKYL